MVLTSPSVGVVPPPFARFAQSSSLSAPPLTALYSMRAGVQRYERVILTKKKSTHAMADSIESTQTSMTRDSGITACPLVCNICGLSFIMVMLELATSEEPGHILTTLTFSTNQRKRRSCDVIPSVSYRQL